MSRRATCSSTAGHEWRRSWNNSGNAVGSQGQSGEIFATGNTVITCKMGTIFCFKCKHLLYWLHSLQLTQNLNRQPLKVLFVGGDDDVFKTAGNF